MRKKRIPLRPSAVKEIGEESIGRHSTSETSGTSDVAAIGHIVQINDPPKHMTSDEQPDWKRWSIYKVPACVAELNRKAYRPQVISFGPYHHGKDHLRPMENHKRRVRAEFFRRSRKPFEAFLESLRVEAKNLGANYDSPPKWREGASDSSADWFLELMITDGCFMLEILMYAARLLPNYYEDNDPIFSKHGELYVHPFIRRDMLLLENQLPMLVLNQLFALQCDEGDSSSEFRSVIRKVLHACKEDEFINRLILNFCSRSVANVSKGKCLHVLDVFRKNMLMEPKKDKAESKDSEEIIRPATELREHGISFEKSDTNSQENISFAGGVLKLPEIVVDDDTQSMFLNLIAFERSHVGAGNEVTSYIFFMDNIIDKGQDVALLHSSGIIKSAMESDEAAAKLFNSLATGVVLDPNSCLHDLINKVSKYCKKRRHKWRASFIHTYCRNPWVMASLIAAVLLFGLTIFQAVYAVLSYNK